MADCVQYEATFVQHSKVLLHHYNKYNLSYHSKHILRVHVYWSISDLLKVLKVLIVFNTKLSSHYLLTVLHSLDLSNLQIYNNNNYYYCPNEHCE